MKCLKCSTVDTCPACEMNDCQRAFEILAGRQDAEAIGAKDGPRLEIRRTGWPSGQLSNGTRAFIVKPCDRWRWLTVTLGWDTIAQLDQRAFYRRPEDLAAAVIAAINKACPGYREELTAAGPQLVIPGCERRPADTGRPVQLGLFG